MREAERFNWAATRGVNEELLFKNMPDDLQRDIRRHLFIFLKKVNTSEFISLSVGSLFLKRHHGFAGEDIFGDG